MRGIGTYTDTWTDTDVDADTDADAGTDIGTCTDTYTDTNTDTGTGTATDTDTDTGTDTDYINIYVNIHVPHQMTRCPRFIILLFYCDCSNRDIYYIYYMIHSINIIPIDCMFKYLPGDVEINPGDHSITFLHWNSNAVEEDDVHGTKHLEE